MPTLSTHILDNYHGRPAAGLRLTLSREGSLLKDLVSNADGRCDRPLLADGDLRTGCYELRFFVRDYYEALGVPCPFLGEVPLVFCIDEGESYHVPLLCSPWSYSTYRGS